MTIKAVILAAGFGTRMGHYTIDTPKPMLPLGGKPLIEHTIKKLKASGIKQIGLNLHYHADKIKNYFGSGEEWGVELTYVYEDSPTGTAGGVKKLANFLQDAEHFVVIYGDIITDLDYQKFVTKHLELATNKKAHATVCIHARKSSNSIVEFNQEMRITNFIERPDENTLKKYSEGIWVNSAIYCFKSDILLLIPSDKPSDLPKDIFPQLLKNHQLFAYKLDANRYAIDSEEKYLEAEKNFSKFNF